MAEEKDEIPTISSDDMSMLRVLLHNIRGISPISTVGAFESRNEDIT